MSKPGIVYAIYANSVSVQKRQRRKETMSHAPETSLSSWELAQRLHKLWCLHSGTGHEIYLEKAAALIDAYVQAKAAALWGHVFQGIEEPCRCDKHQKLNAWVRVREAEMVRDEAEWWYRRRTWPNEEDSARLSASRAALATARKQLEEKT